MDDWIEKARLAKAELVETKYGQREMTLLRLTDGADVNTLRRAIFAVDFLDSLKEAAPALHAKLAGESLFVVEVIARWWVFDEEGARIAADKVSRHLHTVRSLTKAMQDARTKMAPAPKARAAKKSVAQAFQREYLESIASAAFRGIQALLGENLAVPRLRFKEGEGPRLDFRFDLVGKQRVETVAALAVGPYQNKTAYRKRRHEWLFRALALAWTHDHVVLLLPSSDDRKIYENWISDARYRIVSFNKEPFPSSRVPNLYVLNPEDYLETTAAPSEASN
jgi:hypothetical protein